MPTLGNRLRTWTTMMSLKVSYSNVVAILNVNMWKAQKILYQGYSQMCFSAGEVPHKVMQMEARHNHDCGRNGITLLQRLVPTR